MQELKINVDGFNIGAEQLREALEEALSYNDVSSEIKENAPECGECVTPKTAGRLAEFMTAYIFFKRHPVILRWKTVGYEVGYYTNRNDWIVYKSFYNQSEAKKEAELLRSNLQARFNLEAERGNVDSYFKKST